MSESARTREEVAKVASLVLTARRLLASGTLVDLSAIEERVRGLCSAIEAMPREDGRPLREDLLVLIDKLNRLGDDLKEQLAQISSKRAGDDQDKGI